MYNIVVWGSVSLELREDIERIHMRALKIVYKLPMTTPTDEIKKLRQWNPISSYYVKMPVVVTCQDQDLKSAGPLLNTGKLLRHHVKDCANLRSFKIGLSANKHVQVGKSKVSLYMGPSGPWGRCLTPVFLA